MAPTLIEIAIGLKGHETVQTKHFDPHFEKERWKSAVGQQTQSHYRRSGHVRLSKPATERLGALFSNTDAASFTSAVQEGSQGIAARFQYCQPNECAPTFTKPSECRRRHDLKAC